MNFYQINTGLFQGSKWTVDIRNVNRLIIFVFYKRHKYHQHMNLHVDRAKCHRACAKCADSHYQVHAQRLIRVFALHWYMLWHRYQMILLADSEGPDQTERMRSLVWAFICPHMPKDTFLHDAAHLYFSRIVHHRMHHSRNRKTKTLQLEVLLRWGILNPQ